MKMLALGGNTLVVAAEASPLAPFTTRVRSPLLLSSPLYLGSSSRLCYRPSPRCFCTINNQPSSRFSSLEPAAVSIPLPPPPANVSISSVLPYLWNLASGDVTLGWRLFVALFLLIGGKAAGIVGPVLLKFAMDKLQVAPNYLQKHSTNLILGALILSALSKAISAGMNEMRYVIFAPLGHATGRRVAVHLLDHILGLDLTFHLEKSTGVLARVIDRAQRAVVHIFRAVVFTFIPTAIELSLVCVLLAQQVSTTVAGVVLVTFIAYVWWTIDITRAAAASRKEANKVEELVTGKVVDALLNFEMVAQSNNQKLEVQQYNNLLRRHQIAMLDAERLSAALNAGQAFILATGVAVVMALAGLSVIQGSMTIGDLILANGLILQLSGPLQFLGFLYRDLRQSLVDLDSLFKILSTRPSLKDGDVELQKDGPGVKIRAHDLHFSYKSSRQVLNGASLVAEPGESVAIVGSSGSGKSTIVKLLLRLYDPDSGALFMDNLDLRTLTQASLRRAVAVVPQDTVLFNDTIFHNIAYSQPTASEAEVVVAAKQAQLHDAVMRMPGGYNTIVGERGLKLSGGEKQRVAIARAFLKAPRLLICDEATSALDSKTEAGILKTLKELSSGRTCVFVAHRLSTIMHCDKILVMDGGLIIEQGTHQDLLKRKGMYANMWSLQESEEKRKLAPTQTKI